MQFDRFLFLGHTSCPRVIRTLFLYVCYTSIKCSHYKQTNKVIRFRGRPGTGRKQTHAAFGGARPRFSPRSFSEDDVSKSASS